MPAAFFAAEPSTIFIDLKNDISCKIVVFSVILHRIWDYGPEFYKYSEQSYDFTDIFKSEENRCV